MWSIFAVILAFCGDGLKLPTAFNDPTQTFDDHRARDISYISFPITRGGKRLRTAHAPGRRCNWRKDELLRDVNQSRAQRGRRSFNLPFRGRCQVQLSAAYAFAVARYKCERRMHMPSGSSRLSVFAKENSRIPPTSRTRVMHPQWVLLEGPQVIVIRCFTRAYWIYWIYWDYVRWEMWRLFYIINLCAEPLMRAYRVITVRLLRAIRFAEKKCPTRIVMCQNIMPIN